MQTFRRASFLLLCGVPMINAFLVPLGTRISQSYISSIKFPRQKVWGITSGSRSTIMQATSLEPPIVSGTSVAPVLPGMAEEDADDPNEYYEEEPVDLTIDQLKEMSRAELAYVLSDGRTVQQWLDGDQSRFTDGGLVMDWIKEAHRLRLLSFLERAEHLKALSFDDLNLFRSRQVEWRNMLEAKGVLDPYHGSAEEGVTELSDSEYTTKLQKAQSKYSSYVEEEEALLKTVDSLLNGARLEGTAMDNQVRVVMNGRMVPISVTVQEGAMKDARILSQGVESALDAAFKLASEFYEETMATEYIAKAKSPTDLQGIVDELGRKDYKVVADIVDPQMLD